MIVHNVKILLTNSYFDKMDRTALYIHSRYSSIIKRKIISIINCTFGLINADAAIQIIASPVNQSISFTNSKFHLNKKNLIRIYVALPNNRFTIHQKLLLSAINISFINCQFLGNRQNVLV